MYFRHVLASFILVLVVGFAVGAYVFGFRAGVASVPYVDRVSGLTNKESTGAVLETGVSNTDAVDFGPFWKTWNVLGQKFLPVSTSTEDLTSDQAKVIGAIQGLVSSYDDPYTVFFPPEETEIFKESIRGDFQGIGAVIGLSGEGILTITQPLSDAPAKRAGLKAGDQVLAVDGMATQGLTLGESVGYIRGPSGSDVTLSILSEGDVFPRDVVVTRDVVTIPTVASAIESRVKDIVEKVAEKLATEKKENTKEESQEAISEEVAGPQDFSVIVLSSFSRTTASAFKEEFEAFLRTGNNNLILDLRNNQGGFLDVAVDIASYFLEEGKVIVTEKNTTKNAERVFRSKGHNEGKVLGDIDLAILINRNTASAAEILAAALREYNKAKLVGETSFGKGSVQELIDITDTMSLKVTVARWYTPQGNSISGNGLIPDVSVELTAENTAGGADPVLEEAIKLLLEDEGEEK